MVDFGVSIFPTDYSIQPAELARAVEEHGFESLWVTEHTHIPASRQSPWPGGPNLPQEYWHTHDPFVALAAAAAVTTRIRLGTGILLVPEHDPIVAAKSIASLDRVSNGRLVVGIGAGWNAEEMANHGVAFADRWKVTRERVEAWRTIWTEEEASYHGKYVDFDRIWSYPKPVQPGGPPVLLGAQTPWGYQRVIDYCDGWMPIFGRSDLGEGLQHLRTLADKAGRDMRTIQLAVFGARDSEKGVGTLIEQGFQRIVLGLPAAPAAEVLPVIERYAQFAEHMRKG